MSVENVRKFIDLLLQDKELQQELSKAGTDVPKIIALGASRGLDFTAEDIGVVREETRGEFTEEQLEKVAGGLPNATAAVLASMVASMVAAEAYNVTMSVENVVGI